MNLHLVEKWLRSLGTRDVTISRTLPQTLEMASSFGDCLAEMMQTVRIRVGKRASKATILLFDPGYNGKCVCCCATRQRSWSKVAYFDKTFKSSESVLLNKKYQDALVSSIYPVCRDCINWHYDDSWPKASAVENRRVVEELAHRIAGEMRRDFRRDVSGEQIANKHLWSDHDSSVFWKVL